MNALDRFLLVVQIAAKSLTAHRTKNLVIGGLLFFGSFLLVVGSALLAEIEQAMTRSVTQSLAGHLQAYSKAAPNPLALFGSGVGGQEDFGLIEDYSAIKAVLEAEPNVEAAVPMALDSAFINAGNQIDRILDSLRAATKTGDRREIDKHRVQLQEITRLLEAELEETANLTGSRGDTDDKRADLKKAQGPELWQTLATDPEAGLQFLDTRIAPLLDEGRTIPIRYLGADLDAFAERFDRFEIVSGAPVPKGKRGFLLNERFADEVLKHKVARELDAIARVRKEGGRIQGNPLLEGRAKKVTRLYRSIALELDAEEVARLTPVLQKEVPDQETQPITKLLQAFLAVDDSNFDRRYALFYRDIAPAIDVYLFRPGDTVTLRTYTRSGQLRSINVKLYGTFRFKGLDRSDLAGAHNLLDLMSFRDLYDLMTTERQAETEALRRPLAEVTGSEAADDAFFGKDDALTEEVGGTAPFDELSGAVLNHSREQRARLEQESYSQQTIEKGVVLNVAILLKDAALVETTRASLARKLEPLGVQVVTWQTASGIVGQFLLFMRLGLLVAGGIIFFVALVIINNSMLLATVERVSEIGTLLAIGASEAFVVSMFLLEISVLALLSGGFGAAAGSLTVALLGRTGIHASNNVLAFLFSGADLFPKAGLSHFAFGLLVILLVSLASAMYPALLATRISPRVAMEAKE